MKRKNYLFILFIILLCTLVLGASVSLAYFLSQKNVEGGVTLGELDFTVNCNFDENMQALPGSYVLSDIVLVNKKEDGQYENLIPFYFRVKFDAISNNTSVNIIPIFNQNNWFFYDGYYYFKNILYKNDSVDICDNVLIDYTTGNEVQGSLLEINLIFEAIQFNASSELWGEEVSQNLNNF